MSPDEKPANAETEDKSPAEIRAEIEATRREMGDTVEALAEKTDVKAQAKAKVDDVKGQAQAKVEDAKAKAKDLGERAKESPRDSAVEAQAMVKQNPKPLAIAGGVLALLILWRLLRR
jgi:ElaB/YqjD/DUF883 family membrane-anchored ribosome-binding protein